MTKRKKKEKSPLASEYCRLYSKIFKLKLKQKAEALRLSREGARLLGVTAQDVEVLEDFLGYDAVMELFRKVGARLTTKVAKPPIATGVLDYFPDALLAVAEVSAGGNRQHGTTGWDRSKAPDEANAAIRHFLKRGTLDHDGLRHSAKFAWRALALLQKEIERDCATKAT